MMQIKVSSFKSRLQHSLHFDEETSRFLNEIKQKGELELEFADLADYDCDLKLIFIETGGSEGLFLQHFSLLQEPYYLLTSGGNNSLAASLEILTYLNHQQKKGEILHGTPEYIARRIKELAGVQKALKTLKTSTLGVIGKPSDWLIASVPDYSAVEALFGLRLKDIPLSELEKKLKQKHFTSIHPDLNEKWSKEELSKASGIYDGLKELVLEHRLNGLTLRCFDLLTSVRSTGCLGLAYLNKEGIIGTCEGDIMAMISMYIVRLLTGQSSFQANPSLIDPVQNQITFAHCTIPLDMVTSFNLDTHFESGIGVAIKGELLEQKITVFRISADLKHYYVSSGTILKNLNEKNLCRTQITVAMDQDVTELLRHPCGNHHILFYGDHQALLEELMKQVLK